jgi:hypothetical protein
MTITQEANSGPIPIVRRTLQRMPRVSHLSVTAEPGPETGAKTTTSAPCMLPQVHGPMKIKLLLQKWRNGLPLQQFMQKYKENGRAILGVTRRANVRHVSQKIKKHSSRSQRGNRPYAPDPDFGLLIFDRLLKAGTPFRSELFFHVGRAVDLAALSHTIQQFTAAHVHVPWCCRPGRGGKRTVRRGGNPRHTLLDARLRGLGDFALLKNVASIRHAASKRED